MAAAISGFTGDMASFAIIVVVIVLSIVLDIVQEHRAEQAADALRRSVAIHADALRDGRVVSIPVEQLVPGDVVELRAGDLVPADGVIVESRNLHVNEALMTGEPYPVEKRAGDCAAKEAADAFNALFAGDLGGERRRQDARRRDRARHPLRRHRGLARRRRDRRARSSAASTGSAC